MQVELIDDLLFDLFRVVVMDKSVGVNPMTNRGWHIYSNKLQREVKNFSLQPGFDTNEKSTNRFIHSLQSSIRKNQAIRLKSYIDFMDDFLFEVCQSVYDYQSGDNLTMADKDMIRHILSKTRLFHKEHLNKLIADTRVLGQYIENTGHEGKHDTHVLNKTQTLLNDTNWWVLTGLNTLNKVRCIFSIKAMQKMKVTQYRVKKFDDDVNSVCNHLHDQVFDVRDAIKTIEWYMAAHTTEQIKRYSPWLTSDNEYIILPGGEKINIETGKKFMVEAHAILPSYHPFCRTTIEPV